MLAKQQAADAGAAEVFMIEDGYVTEGGSSSVFVITKDNMVVTRPLSTAILAEITRRADMRLAEIQGLAIEERAVTIDEALDAAEVFYTSASSFVIPVVTIDGRPIGDGRPGPLVKRLREALHRDGARRPSIAPAIRLPTILWLVGSRQDWRHGVR